MSARYSIVCDACGVVAPEPSRQSIASARRRAPKGWTNPRPGIDRCADCSAKAAEKARKENPNGYL